MSSSPDLGSRYEHSYGLGIVGEGGVFFVKDRLWYRVWVLQFHPKRMPQRCPLLKRPKYCEHLFYPKSHGYI